jgi:replicative DNA helicase
MFLVGRQLVPTHNSTILRQMAAAVANGLHPFLPGQPIQPHRTLTVDAENPVDVIEHQARLIDRVANRALSQSGEWWLWHVESGLNLTQRADQARFEQVLEVVRPKLVTMGPAYKLYPVKVGEDWSTPTLTFLQFVHEQAVRFGFAVIIEHHAPKGGSQSRDLFPAGASEWLRWPEFGIKLTVDKAAGKDDHNRPMGYFVGRFRGDRLPAQWPVKLVRRPLGGTTVALPWEGIYPDGTF